MTNFIVVDTETTGTAWASDRLVQIAWQVFNAEGKVASTENIVVKPEGYTIPPAATRVHGITTQAATRNGASLLGSLKKFICACREADAMVGHNLPFDVNFLRAEIKRANLDFDFNGIPHLCTMRLSTRWCRLPKLNGAPGFKWPKLDELHFALFGESFDGAHDALSDVKATKRCFLALVKRGIIDITGITKAVHSDRASGELVQEIRMLDDSDKKTKRDPLTSSRSEKEVGGSPFKPKIQERDRAKLLLKVFERAASAIEQSSLQDFRELANSKKIAQCENPYGWTLLHFASFSGEVEMSQLLLDRGANANARSRGGLTPMHLVMSASVLEALFKYGGDVQARSLVGCTPLHLAAHWGDVELIEALVESGADTQARCPNGLLIIDSINNGVLDDYEHLTPQENPIVGYSMPFPELDCYGYSSIWPNHIGGSTALHWSTTSLSPSILEFLLARDFNIEDRDEAGNTPLHWAAGAPSSKFTTAEILLDAGSDIHAVNVVGAQPIHLAAAEGSYEALSTISKRGAEAGSRDHFGRSPLNYALLSVEREIEWEIEYEELYRDTGFQLPPLKERIFKIVQRRSRGINFLLSLGVSVSEKDCNGISPWDIAMRITCLREHDVFWRMNDARFE